MRSLPVGYSGAAGGDGLWHKMKPTKMRFRKIPLRICALLCCATVLLTGAEQLTLTGVAIVGSEEIAFLCTASGFPFMLRQGVEMNGLRLISVKKTGKVLIQQRDEFFTLEFGGSPLGGSPTVSSEVKQPMEPELEALNWESIKTVQNFNKLRSQRTFEKNQEAMARIDADMAQSLDLIRKNSAAKTTLQNKLARQRGGK